MSLNREQTDISRLFDAVSGLITEARKRVAVAINAEATLLNFKVGVYIQSFILEGNRAPYGKQIITNLSHRLTQTVGSGWSAKHVRHCLRCAESFSEEQIVSAVQRQLSWTHLKTLAYEKDALKREFYLEMAILNRWNTRTLTEQIEKMLYERSSIAARPKEEIAHSLKALKEEDIITPELVFKSSYVLDFLDLQGSYSEQDVEIALIANLQHFILELGKFKPEYKAQMELYLRWLQKYEMQNGEDSPVGLLLCSEGNTEHIELLMLDNNEIKVAQYLTELPDKEWFSEKLLRALEIAKMNQVESNERNIFR